MIAEIPDDLMRKACQVIVCINDAAMLTDPDYLRYRQHVVQSQLPVILLHAAGVPLDQFGADLLALVEFDLVFTTETEREWAYGQAEDHIRAHHGRTFSFDVGK